MTPAALHEQHKARVLDTPRQHHDEATDALVVEALRSIIDLSGCEWGCTSPGDRCIQCRCRDKAQAALKALGK